MHYWICVRENIKTHYQGIKSHITRLVLGPITKGESMWCSSMREGEQNTPKSLSIVNTMK